MKKTIWIFFLYLFAIAVLPSCKKTEDQPRDLYTYDLAFDPADQDAVLAQRFLAGLYNYLPTGFNRISGDFLDAATDDAVSIVSNAPITYYTNGILSTGNNPESYWSNSYAGIRQVNIFLANIDKIPIPAANPNRTLGFKAEARFIRAFLYFELLKRYGGVPLIGDKIFTLDDNLQLSRNTFSQCADYITSECDAIKTYLYPDAIADPNLGRIVKGAAIALKCRVYLYAASPLYNGGGLETNPTLKAITGYPTADPTRWQKVVDAVTEFNALGWYTLIAPSANTAAAGTTAYTNIFVVRSNKEVILAKQTNNNFDIENANAPVGFSVNNFTGGGRTNPTQNFVDAFTTITGKPITDPTSGYDPNNPYAARDPRLAASVFYNGSKWLNRAVETFDGGRDRPNNNNGPQTRTGYYLRKFMFDFSNSSSYSSNSHNFPYFRYAEIVLDNAEALNELGRTPEAVTEISRLRKRANIQAGTDGRYGIPAGISQIDMRTLIQNERRIELSFEEQRFFDLRRWKLGNTELNKTLNGIKITNNGNGTFSYQVVPVTNILFQDKLYHLPLPYDETVKDANLVQNFGW